MLPLLVTASAFWQSWLIVSLLFAFRLLPQASVVSVSLALLAEVEFEVTFDGIFRLAIGAFGPVLRLFVPLISSGLCCGFLVVFL